MPITMLDIARETQVSLATVSRVLNKTAHPISNRTKKKVLDAARRLGYEPNLHARNLATGTNRVLELFLDITYDAAGETGFGILIRQMLLALNSVAEQQGYSVIVDLGHSTGPHATDYRGSSFPIAGGLILTPRQNDPRVPYLVDRNVPFMVIGSIDYHQHNFVDVDNIAGATAATEYLIRLGHCHIGFLGGPSNFRPSLDRMAGFRRALRSHQLRERPEWVLSGEWTWENGFELMRQLLGRAGNRPTAIFASNDMLASGAVRAIRSAGLKVPQDISVIGFDDMPSSAMIDPPLTTVRQPFFEMGRLATLKLIEIIEAGAPLTTPYQDLIIPELIERESCSVRKPM